MKTAQAQAQVRRQSINNYFRPAWTYQRMPAGDAMLAEGRGLSPAFFRLLEAVEPERPVSFNELSLLFPRLHADDLELWLAELCRMALIAPAAHAVATGAAALRAPGPAVEMQLARASQTQANIHADVHTNAHAGTQANAQSDTETQKAHDTAAEPGAAKEQRSVITPAPTPPAGYSAAPRAAGPAPAREVCAREPFDLGVAWKNLSVETLYNELLAICAELDAREPNQMGALAGALAR